MNSEISNNVSTLSPVTIAKTEKQAESRLASTANEKEVVRAEARTAPSGGPSDAIGKVFDEKSKDPNNKDGKNASVDVVKKAVDEANALPQMVKRNLQFKIDEDTSELVVKIIDSESGEMVRQIPSEEMLALIRRMQDSEEQLGLMIRDRA